MRKYYPGITFFKLTGSLLVLMGHVYVPGLFFQYGRVPGLQQAVAAIVPCFYMISGFLAYKGWTSAARPQVYMRRYLGGLAAIYATLCGLALLTEAAPKAVYSPGAWHNRVLPLLKIYLIEGPYGAMWFIPPLLVGVGFCYYCQRHGYLRWALVAVGVGFVAAQLLAGTGRVVLEAASGNLALYHWRYSGLLTTVVVNYLGVGLPFILAGLLVARHEATFVGLPAGRLAVLVLGSLGLEFLLLSLLAPAEYSNLSYPLILGILPVGVWLFYGVLHIGSIGIERYHAGINRFSGLLYFLHQPLLSGSLAALGFSLSAIWTRSLTPWQAFAVMLLTALQVGLLAWFIGWLRVLMRRGSTKAVAVAEPPLPVPVATDA